MLGGRIFQAFHGLNVVLKPFEAAYAVFTDTDDLLKERCYFSLTEYGKNIGGENIVRLML